MAWLSWCQKFCHNNRRLQYVQKLMSQAKLYNSSGKASNFNLLQSFYRTNQGQISCIITKPYENIRKFSICAVHKLHMWTRRHCADINQKVIIIYKKIENILSINPLYSLLLRIPLRLSHLHANFGENRSRCSEPPYKQFFDKTQETSWPHSGGFYITHDGKFENFNYFIYIYTDL